MKEKLSLSRRNVLLGIGTVGIASAGAGLGTTAYFSDEESFTENAFTAGRLDLTVDYTTKYNGAPEESGTHTGRIDGEPATGGYSLGDVKPGDSGCLEFCFEIEDNPAYMWACGDLLSNGENNRSGLERSAGDDSTDVGELADSIDARLLYCENGDNDQHDDDDDDDDNLLASGTLTEILQTLSTGVPLDAHMREGILTPGRQKPYEMENRDGNITGPCLCLEWSIDFESVGNEIQSDTIEFDIAFHALQARHADGTINPCAPTITTRTGEGFAKQSEDFNGRGDGTSFARGRFGGPGSSDWELAVGQNVGNSTTGQYTWTSGETVPFSYEYDGTDDATFTLDGNAVSYSGIQMPNGRVAITTKADEASVLVENLTLSLDGTEVGLSGPTSIGASNDGDGREVTYLVFDTDASDLEDGFTLEGDVTVTLLSSFGGGREDVAFDVTLE